MSENINNTEDRAQDWDLEERDQWLEEGRLHDDSQEPESETVVGADE